MFEKTLLTSAESIDALKQALTEIKKVNENVKVIIYCYFQITKYELFNHNITISLFLL